MQNFEPVTEVSILDAKGGVQLSKLNTGELGAAANLPYAPERYFELNVPSAPIRLENLVLSRVRPRGVANAANLMRASFEGKHPKRRPVSVRQLRHPLFLVVDGNSTVINARSSHWPDIPCQLIDDAGASKGAPHAATQTSAARAAEPGGHIVASGTPEDIAECQASYTGQYLRPHLARRPARRRAG